MAKKENPEARETNVSDPNKFMKILLSTNLDSTHLKEFEFKITDLGKDNYQIVGELEGADTINFEHTWKQ
jgi:hypothetical protein